ncbi:MAG: hypothetical protein ACI3Y5_01745 [Prevotella sp.]
MQAKTFLMILFLALSNVGMAQVRVSVSDLIGTRWKVKDSSGKMYKTYTSERVLVFKDDVPRVVFSKPYYLTDRLVKSNERSAFDYSKVGKGTKGRYLVTINEKRGFTDCFLIRRFDKKKGIMEMKLITDSVFIGWDRVTVCTLMK